MHSSHKLRCSTCAGAVLAFTISLFLISCGSFTQGQEEVSLDERSFNDPPAQAYDNLHAFEIADIPRRDLVNLTKRFNDIPDVAHVARNEAANFQEGDVTEFWYKDQDMDENIRTRAELVYRSDHLNLWFEEGIPVRMESVRLAAKTLENQILPTSRSYFGREWQPGVDGDSRVNILHLADLGTGVIGYFSQADEFVTEVNRFSNEMELFYVNHRRAPVGSERYFHVIAHELQHMIHWYADGNEDVWINEGLAEMSAFVNGYQAAEYINAFARQPDVQLTDFDYQGSDADAHYGASFLFFLYLLEQYGEDIARSLVTNEANGSAGIEQVLSDFEDEWSFNEFFARWLVASYLDNAAGNDAKYGYNQLDMPEMTMSQNVRRYPVRGDAVVHQHGADFLRAVGNQPVTFVFTGTQQVALVDTDPRSGLHFWSSFPADDSDMTLTREVDLSAIDEAVLSFWTWYDLEEGWDYAYVSVSTDGGNRWFPLETDSSTLDDPQGNSFGPAYTGRSGGGDVPAWTRETANLSQYAGREILLRFEVITDDTIHGQGFVLDDIAIPEINFFDDVESGEGDWLTEGFIRHSNLLPQEFLVQILIKKEEVYELKRMDVDSGQRGHISLPFGEEIDEAVIIISGITPYTNHSAAYRYHFTE